MATGDWLGEASSQDGVLRQLACTGGSLTAEQAARGAQGQMPILEEGTPLTSEGRRRDGQGSSATSVLPRWARSAWVSG